MKRIYLDNAATTPLDENVKKKMHNTMNAFGNPSSMYQEAWEAQKIMEDARQKVAGVLNAQTQEIIFTGSGTESDNLALFGVARAYRDKGNHIITTKIEHPAVLRSVEQLEREGFDVTYLNIQENGIIDLEELKKALRDDSILVSVMYVNNEIGTIQPIKEIAQILKDKETLFHTDACQATNYLSMNVQELGVDLMTFSGSKIYGPKGVGVLYKKDGVKLQPVIYGGGQEKNLRSGTENIMLIDGLATALEITEQKKEVEKKRLTELRNYFMNKVVEEIDEVYINGDREGRIPNNVHLSVNGVEGEALVLMLDYAGVSAATGSACSSKDLNISHVLEALAIPEELAHGSLRFTLGRHTTQEDIDYTIQELKKIVTRLRSFSAA